MTLCTDSAEATLDRGVDEKLDTLLAPKAAMKTGVRGFIH